LFLWFLSLSGARILSPLLVPAALIMELKLIEVGLVLLKSRLSIKAARFHWLLVSAAAIEPQKSLVITTS
jgi:hypothetical protein